MDDVGLVNLDKAITKTDWVSVVSWVNLRWPVNWTDEDIKSLWEDYKVFPSDVIWQSLQNYQKNGHEFFNHSKFFQACHETWIRLEQDVKANQIKQQLPAGKDMYNQSAGGLIEYLELNGYDSFAHAVYETQRKRVASGNPFMNEDEWIDADEPWESARAGFLQKFPVHKTLEQLKAVRDKGENNGK